MTETLLHAIVGPHLPYQWAIYEGTTVDEGGNEPGVTPAQNPSHPSRYPEIVAH